MLTIDPRIKFDNKYDNEYDNTTTFFFVADTSLLKEFVGDKYPEADGMTISIECPMNCFDAYKASVEISPYEKVDGTMTDYDWTDIDWTNIVLSYDQIDALINLAMKHLINKETKHEPSIKQPMEKDKIKFIHKSLGESKDFVKEVRQYLYEIEKQRPLTEIEQKLWNKTHDIHVHTEDSRMFIQEEYDDIY